ncbi:MAG: glycoside hydrolase family 13 protein [Candidatus Marinimicrobia bacterium]|nr:glycoside hydrolase family 13 protein [Candidatus Neomarinimicrobiota bacterium]MBL7046520.1 glycoside hydrolase family 13 protein [Candidatus Neomarinimicrobiota bacterium]
MKHFHSYLHLLLIVTLLSADNNKSYQIDHLEPPFWWTDMANNTLQLMVHGKNIADLEPEFNFHGVLINKVHRVENPNYLFIDLLLSGTTRPGKFDILFNKSGQTIISHPYEILKRTAGSAERQGFSPADVIYLITPDRYANGNPDNDSVPSLKEKPNRRNKDGRHGGDIKGIIDHLDYIAEMGFTQIWLNPVLENNQKKYSYHGYSTTDYYNIDERFGTNELYKELSESAQNKGIGIIMDLILNHIGSEHWLMYDLPSSDWINHNGEFVQTSHIHESIYDPYIPQFEKDLFTSGWFVKTMPDLNQSNPFLANYLIQLSIWWVEYAKLSGFRIDTYPYIDKDFLTIWSKRIAREYPNFNFCGEAWNNNPSMVAYWQKGSKPYDGYISYIPSMKDFPLQKALVQGLMSEEKWDSGIGDIYRVLANDYQYGDPYNLLVFAGNHDMQRIYSQLSENMDLYKIAMSFILTTRGIPQIYYGAEIAMTSTRDHGELRKDFPGGWAGDKIDAFNGIRLSGEQREAQNFMRDLLNWRKSSSAIGKGSLVHYPVKNGVYVYFRLYENDLVMVMMNNNKRSIRIDPGRFNEVLAEKNQGISVLDNRVYDLTSKINLPGKTALILEIN